MERKNKRNPQEIRQIGTYQLPSDDDLIRQSINEIICETCFFADHAFFKNE